MGAPNTMSGNISKWIEFESWAIENIPRIKKQASEPGQFHLQHLKKVRDLPVNDLIYPPSEVILVAYLDALIAQRRGPTVPDSFLGAVRWICKRLEMECPDTLSNEIVSKRAMVFESHIKVAQETKPFPDPLVKSLEEFIMKDSHAPETRVIAWFP